MQSRRSVLDVLDEARPPVRADRPRPSFGRTLIREPLIHFVLLGGLLFAVYGYLHRGVNDVTSYEIELTPQDISQMQTYFFSQWHRQPNPQEFSNLLEERVREEILYREALGMGLDKGDSIVKRRMEQKMEFLAEDVANSHEPTRAELKAWYAKHEQQFAIPAQVSFRHLYFSPDRRGVRAKDDAASALLKMAGQPESSTAAASLYDRFMLQDRYQEVSLDELAKDFGLPFARSLFQFKPGSWQGPIQSGYGWHLVFVRSVSPGRVSSFEDVEPDVKAAWLAEQRAEQWQKTYSTMRAKYQIVLPAGTAVAASSVATTAGTRPVALPSEGLR
jgi:peptidyl-prolyl cis-trans isomerase C